VKYQLNQITNCVSVDGRGLNHVSLSFPKRKKGKGKSIQLLLKIRKYISKRKIEIYCNYEKFKVKKITTESGSKKSKNNYDILHYMILADTFAIHNIS